MIARFFSEQLAKEGEELLLSPTESHHCIHVKRIEIGDLLFLFDGQGRSCEAQLLSIQKKQALVKITSSWQEQAPTSHQFHLAIAPPKGDHWDFLLQKATELGVHRITPLHCERSVVLKKERKTRWEQILLEACKQCCRNDLPQIEDPASFSSVLQRPISEEESYLMASSQQGKLLKELTPHCKSKITILIGPEGGFTEKEIQQAKERQCLFFHEPGSILRIETAGLAFLAILRHLFQPL